MSPDVNLTLSEISSLARLAAKGAGHSWPIAAEAGMAARWLASNGFDAGQLVLSVILTEKSDFKFDNKCWSSVGDVKLNPLYVGPSLCDFADLDAYEVRNIASPAVLCPFVFSVAKAKRQTLELAWPGASVLLDGHSETCRNEGREINSTSCHDVGVQQMTTNLAAGTLCSRASLSDEVFHKLKALAEKTYAPATEESRRLGAGGD